MSQHQLQLARRKCVGILSNAGIILTASESSRIEVVDFGLGQLATEGLGIVVYVNNDRYCAKELVMFPRQTCPEHRHPPVGADPGKMETFRVRQGLVWLYVEGTRAKKIKAVIPPASASHYTVFHEVVLKAGMQFTIPPNTLHWFQAGDDGAIVSEFSSRSRDELDAFTDPRVQRVLSRKRKRSTASKKRI
jgi:D-lyxose ketol-isomerase